MGFFRNVGRAVFAALIALSIARASVAEKEPLVDHVAIFNAMDETLRAADPSVHSTNQLAWVEQAIEAKQELYQQDQIEPWLNNLSAACSNDWRVLRAVAMGHIADFRSSDASVSVTARLMDRAYRLAREENTAPDEMSCLIDDYISYLLHLHDNPRLLSLKTIDIPPESVAEIQNRLLAQMNDGEILPPELYPAPVSYESAANDGEIIRWLIANKPLKRYDSPSSSFQWTPADFAVYVAGAHNNLPRKWDANGAKKRAEQREQIDGVLYNLKDDQSVVWRRGKEIRDLVFDLPQDYQFISAYKARAMQGDRAAAETLANVYFNRRQLNRTIEWYERTGATNMVRTIRANQGALRSHRPQLADRTQIIEYDYRNGTAVDVTIHPINLGTNPLPRLITDEMMGSELELLEGDPKYFHEFNLAEQAGVLAPAVTNWTAALSPRPNHLDNTHLIEVPPLHAGFYLLRANLHNGNQSKTVLHVYDTMMLCGDLQTDHDDLFDRYHDEKLRILCDARTGAPLTNEQLHFYRTTGGVKQIKDEEHSRKNVDGREKLNTYIRRHTNKSGMLITDDDEDYMNIIMFTDRPHPVVMLYGGTSLRVSGHGQGDYEWTGDPRFFLTTDRPVYRPGDTGHLKYWIPDESAYEPNSLTLSHEEKNEEIPLVANTEPDEDGDLPLDEFGGIDFSFTIPTNTPLGVYVCRRDGANRYDRKERVSFRVEEYRAPEVLIDAAFTADGQLLLTAKHAYGEPLAGGTLKAGALFNRVDPNIYHPTAPFDAVWGNGYGWNGDQIYSPDDAEDDIDCGFQFEVELDATGQAIVDLAAATNGPAAIATPGYFRINATIADTTGKRHSATTEVPTPPTIGPKLCIWLDKAFYDWGDTIDCHVDTANWESADRVEIRSQHGEVLQNTPLNGRKTISVDLLPAGIYEARFISKNNQEARPFQFVVCNFTDTDLTPESPIRLVVEKGVYRHGETARVLIQIDQPGRYVYLFPSVSRQFGFAKPHVFEMTKTSRIAELKLDHDLLHKGVIQCAAMTIIDGKVSLVNHPIHVVSPELDAGTIELTPGKQNYAPGEDVSLSIKTLASDGVPRPCSVTITVYNEVLDFWTRWRSTDLIKTLFSSWRDCRYEKVSAGDTHSTSLDAIHPKWVMRSLLPNGGSPYDAFSGDLYMSMVTLFGSSMSIGTDEPSEKSTPPQSLRVREDFRDLAYWNTTIQTDDYGVANVSFPMPDGLVKWKIQAWATHTNYAATATTSINCTKDFVAHLNTPRFMREGDELALSTAIRNHATNTLPRVSANVAVEGIELKSATSAEIVGLKPGAETNIYWSLRAANPGEAEITTKAWNAATADGMKKSIPILPRGMLKRGGRGGVLAGDKTSETITIDIPAEIEPETLDCQLNVTPNMLDALENALPFLAEYPHGCAEQTLNRFLPALIVMSTLEELGVAVTNRDAVIERARIGIEKLEEALDYRGDWGWNLDRDSPRDPFISAWVLRGLNKIAHMKEVDLYDIDLEDSKGYLLNRMDNRLKKSAAPSPEKISNIDAMRGLCLAEIGVGNMSRHVSGDEALLFGPNTNDDQDSKDNQATLSQFLEHLLAKADQLSLYGKVLLALAFENQGDAENRDKLIAYIEQYLERDAETGAAWLRTGANEFWWWYNDDIETHAWYLKLLNRVDPTGERAAGVARHLMLDRVYGDHWKSTRDTAICIEALAEFAKNNQLKADAAKPIITLNGTRVEDPAAINLAPGSNTLTIASPSGAPLFHDITWEYYSRENPITAETCELVTIERKYYRPAEKKEDRTEIQPGESIMIGDRIEVELTIHTSQRLEYLLAEDFKPAGFETIDQTSGYADGAYRELHDERVSYYLSRVSQGETRLTYEMRAEHAGTVSALPATVKLMYEPRQAANSEERVLKIER